MTQSRSLFTNKSLLTLGVSESISNIGNWITMLAIFTLVVFRGQGGVLESSGIFMAGLLPLLVVSPIAGWLCDRYDRKLLMISSELLSGFSVAGLIFTHRLEMYYALLALQGVFISIMTPARQAVIPEIVSRDDLARANAFLQQLAGIIKIGGPLLAGAVLAVMDPHTAIVLDFVSFIISAAILTRLPSLPAPKTRDLCGPLEARQDGARAEKINVLSVLRKSAGLRLLMISLFSSVFIIVGFDVLASVYIRDVLHADEKFFGVCIGFVGAGTLLSTALLMLNKKQARPWRDLFLGIIGLSFIPITFGLGTIPREIDLVRILAYAGCLIGGAGNGLVIVQSGTLLQVLSPAQALGRMGGVYQASGVAGQMAGILLTPLLVPGILDMRSYFSCSALGLLFLALVVILSVRKMPQTFGS